MEIHSHAEATLLSDEKCIALYLLLLEEYPNYQTDDKETKIRVGRMYYRCLLKE